MAAERKDGPAAMIKPPAMRSSCSMKSSGANLLDQYGVSNSLREPKIDT